MMIDWEDIVEGAKLGFAFCLSGVCLSAFGRGVYSVFGAKPPKFLTGWTDFTKVP